MFRPIKPDDIRITPFTSNKQFSFTHASSGSGVYGIKAVSASHAGYISQSDARIFEPTASDVQLQDRHKVVFHGLPAYYWARNRYYNTFDDREVGPLNNFGGNNVYTNLKIHGQCNIISVPSLYYGLKIMPGSITLTDNSPPTHTVTLKDDGFGNLYDNNYSASFASYQSSSYDATKLQDTGSGGPQKLGGVVGNVFYSEGILVITDTGSLYKDVGSNSGSNGWELDFQSTTNMTEYEYFCDVPEFKFNKSTNITTTFERSGSIEVPESSSAYKFFPPGNSPTHNLGSISASSYGERAYGATERIANFVTHSEFAPYITQIGLYNDQNQLLAMGKLARPIKNDDELALGFVVRFDVNS